MNTKINFKHRSIQEIKKLIQFGKDMAVKYDGAYEKWLHQGGEDCHKIHQADLGYFLLGWEDPDFTLIVKTYYRVGCPLLDPNGEYYNSYNYAENRTENGISVISEDWLKSYRGFFFGIDDDTIQEKGVYEIVGFEVGKGSDGEPTIFALTEAKRTNIRTRDELFEKLKHPYAA